MSQGFRPLRGQGLAGLGRTAGLFDWYDDYRAGIEGGGAFSGPPPATYTADELCLPSASPEQRAKCEEAARRSQANYQAWRQANWWDPTIKNPNVRGLPGWVKAIGLVVAALLAWFALKWAAAPRSTRISFA